MLSSSIVVPSALTHLPINHLLPHSETVEGSYVFRVRESVDSLTLARERDNRTLLSYSCQDRKGGRSGSIEMFVNEEEKKNYR